jgi:uncharacterized membrane protein
LALAREAVDARRQRIAIALIGALVLLLILWETVLAPLRAGGSWLVLKALPLALVWPGLSRGRIRSRQIASLLLPFYFAEAIVRGLTETGRQSLVAWFAAALSAAAFAALLLSFRKTR